MANSITQKISELFSKDKKLFILAAVGFAAIMLILLSEIVPSYSKRAEKKNQTDFSSYSAQLEKDTQELISSINGVGRCKVMITFKGSGESVYAKNTDETFSDSSNSIKNEYVLYNGQSGGEPIVIKQYFPDVMGVAVVCDGADNTAVRESVVKSISSLFNLPVTKISVSKYKG